MDNELIKEFLLKNTKMFLQDISTLQPKERAAAFIKLLDIVSKEKHKTSTHSISPNHWTDSEIESRVKELDRA